MSFTIGSFRIGAAGRTFIIAEVAQAHDGSLGQARCFIDAAADAGADAIKFQTHIAQAESTRDEQFRIPLSGQDASRWDYWKRMEFTEKQWRGLAEHAEHRGLVFLSSPFSVEAVELLSRVGMSAWKLGSGEVFNTRIFDAIAATGAPVLLSSGMSSYADIGQAVNAVRARGLPLALLQCTTQYPTALSDVGLNVIEEFRRRFDCPVGLSDHSGTVYPGLAAMATGADLLEVHITFDRRMYGPDTTSSLTTTELAELAAANRAFATMRSHPVDKDQMAARLRPLRELFSKSIAPVHDLPAGQVLGEDLLCFKKPGTGIPADRLADVIGRRLAHPVSAERLLKWEDLAD